MSQSKDSIDKKPKILVVDDRLENLFAMEKALCRVNATVITAQSGNEALSLVMRHQFALILMDVQMPGMDGFETVALIHGEDKSKDIPIIFVTAISKEDQYVLKGYHTGAVDYIFKPFDKNVLIAKVNIMLELHTKQKQLEDKIIEHKKIENRLLQEISERKSMERKLILATQQAESANNYKSMFLANISHEIRTPMHAILGFTDLLLEDDLTNEQRETLEIVQNSSNTLLTIINDLLDLSKVEAGKIELEQLPINIKHIVADIIKLISNKIESEKITLLLSVDENVPSRLIGDPTRLKQILLNLYNNALKFTQKGKIELRVFCKDEDDSNSDLSNLQFEIEDTGIGIAETKIETIFDAFEQADSSTTRKFGGTGLGLSLTKHLINLMNGDINVTSHEGKGSVFSFNIKLNKIVPKNAGKTDLASENHTLNHNEKNKSPAEKLKILVVEDNAVNRKLIGKQLDRFGFEIDFAIDGKIGVDLATSNAYSIILMDMNLPIMSGVDATRKIRQFELDQGGHVPIIAMTANAMKGTREECLRAGMDDYLTKPVNKELLKTIIAKYDGTREFEILDNRHRILLVDDEEVFLEILEITFQTHFPTAKIKTATNGIQASAFLGSFLPTIVVMDLNMPEMNGVSLAKFILNDERYKNIHILTLTGLSKDNEQVVELKKLGLNDIYFKPEQLNELIQNAREIISS